MDIINEAMNELNTFRNNVKALENEIESLGAITKNQIFELDKLLSLYQKQNNDNLNNLTTTILNASNSFQILFDQLNDLKVEINNEYNKLTKNLIGIEESFEKNVESYKKSFINEIELYNKEYNILLSDFKDITTNIVVNLKQIYSINNESVNRVVNKLECKVIPLLKENISEQEDIIKNIQFEIDTIQKQNDELKEDILKNIQFEIDTIQKQNDELKEDILKNRKINYTIIGIISFIMLISIVVMIISLVRA